MSRIIDWDLEIDWDRDGTYTDESGRLLRADGSMRMHPPEAQITATQGIVDRMSLTLDNSGGRYSPLNSSGPLYSAIQDGNAYHAPVYLRVSVDGGTSYDRIFTGVIKIPQEIGATSKVAPTVTFDCRSRDELLLQKRLTSTQSAFVAVKNNGESEEEIIARWLALAGLTDGTDYVSQAYVDANPGSTATLDPGLFVIPWAWLDDESPLTEIWALAAACGGRFYCDPDGVFRYENATHWLISPHGTSQETVGKSNFVTIRPAYRDRELFNSVTVEVSPREVLDSDTIWEADTVNVVPPNDTITVTARLRQPVWAIGSVNYTAITSGGTDITTDISISHTDYAQRVEISITNANTTQAANLVLLSITGQALSGSRSGEESAESADSFWTGRTGRNRSVRGNFYVQSGAQAAMLANFLVDRHETPRLFFQVEGVRGDPGRRLGDRITLSDGDVMSSSREGWILAINWQLGPGFVHSYEVVDAANFLTYADTSPDYFVIGTDKLGNAGTSSSPGRLFY